MAARVLIVDDEPHIAKIVGRFLLNAGYDVESAVNGEDALNCIAGAVPDVIITDIKMPRMNGKSLCEALDEQYPDRIGLRIVMTSQTELELRDWAETKPNVELMEKPVSPRRLVMRVNQYFNSAEAQ